MRRYSFTSMGSLGYYWSTRTLTICFPAVPESTGWRRWWGRWSRGSQTRCGLCGSGPRHAHLQAKASSPSIRRNKAVRRRYESCSVSHFRLALTPLHCDSQRRLQIVVTAIRIKHQAHVAQAQPLLHIACLQAMPHCVFTMFAKLID